MEQDLSLRTRESLSRESLTSYKPNIISILTLDRLSLTRRAVDSVLENSVGEVKMVFFDNGSKDSTLDYLRNLKREYPDNVTILTSDVNLGVAAGRNRIFKYVISKYNNQFGWILNLDNDCMVHQGYDEAITNCIKEAGALVVCPNLLQPDGSPYYNAKMGFMVDLHGKRLKLEYTSDEPLFELGESSRIETDVILGTSAKTPEFLKRVGFYDEGQKIGWEDFSISLKALGLKKESFTDWIEKRRNGQEWVSLKELMNGQKNPLVKIIFEPACVLTHDHPFTEEFRDYEKIRREKVTIENSRKHFEEVWGVKPVSRRD